MLVTPPLPRPQRRLRRGNKESEEPAQGRHSRDYSGCTMLLHTDSGHFDGHRGTGRPDGLSRLCASSGTGGIHRPDGLCVLAEKAL